MKLSVTQINNTLKPKDKPYKASDGNGLILIINPNGKKWWRFNYRFDGKQKTLSMGVYPDIGLAEARQQVADARQLVAQGINPSDQRKQAKAIKQGKTSFETIAHQWIDNKAHKWSEKHTNAVIKSFELNVFNHIGHTPIDQIRPSTMIKVLKVIENRGSLETLKKVRQRCNGVFVFAKIKELIISNPCEGLEEVLKSNKVEQYNHITHKELPELITAIENGGLEPTTKTGLMIALLTFQRTNEIRYASWDEIDFDAATWTIPAHRMKMKREHVIPLSKQALQLFKELQPITGDYPFIFASYHKPMIQPFSNNAMLFALYRLGFRGRMTVHGFRHLASTTLNELGFDSRHIEKQLSHEDSNTIRGTYNKAEYIAERTKMMQQWSDFVLNIDAKIIPIHRVN